ncbi:MAG: isoleucine--tRNA ligase [Candidatus Rokubacteria bacterium]|nr:isoleucine--tRNA ligase [Candidatus Rokubacteria bacterium]
MFTTPGPLDFVALARETLAFWDRHGIFAQLVAKNRGGPRYSFLDGPITANNPMGVHHARGRTYKDVVQRHRAMRGFDQRFQNGFDCQGLWVEVEVERALGFDGKGEIERMGLDAFARACRERVVRFAALQTEQSRRLGQWMDWERSYYTMSDTNIAYIWHFLAECHRRGWLYQGHRVMPWCVRCGTSISQHEMLDSYAELTHRAVVVALPIAGRERAALLAWTTTPWTLPANVALAVHPELTYEGVVAGDRVYYVAAAARARFPELRDVRDRVTGAELVGLRYVGPFDDLPAQQGVEHRVVAWDDVVADEGTGIVHVAPGCGQEDFELGRRHGLATLAPAGEDGRYGPGFGWLEGRSVLEAVPDVITNLRGRGLLFHDAAHRHRYPTCWRCGQELIFRLVDEWFLRADEVRPLARAANAEVVWHPEHMRLRMDDWLANMGDWCISRKRYWGLPLPFYPCASCQRLTVVRSVEDLRALALDPHTVDSLPELHRPWIDAVALRCPGCGGEVRRVTEVGDCWLDAGVVPFSTLGYLEDRAQWARWFPADFVVEMAAQIRGWFYALLFMSVTLEGRAPYRTVMAHERVLGEDGREMHKSWGNAVWFDEAVDRMGPDVIRYLFASQPAAEPMRFGYGAGREVTRRFLTLWNVYSLFVTYANLDRPALTNDAAAPRDAVGLDTWVLARLQTVVRDVGVALDGYQLRRAVQAVEAFVQDDLSNWYVRRRRRWFWKGEMTAQKLLAYRALHHVLVRVCQLLAPVTPFVADHLYRALLVERAGAGVPPVSVHLTAFPEPDPALEDADLEIGVAFVRRALSVGLAARNAAGVKVRQPLGRAVVIAPAGMHRWLAEFEADVRDELNVEAVELHESAPALDPTVFATAQDGDVTVALDTRLTPALRRQGLVRHLVHQVQMLRKDAGLSVADRIHLFVSTDAERRAAVEEHAAYVCAETLAVELGFDAPPDDGAVRQIKLDGGAATVGLVRAAYDGGRP